jgi:hypothetical protein
MMFADNRMNAMSSIEGILPTTLYGLGREDVATSGDAFNGQMQP